MDFLATKRSIVVFFAILFLFSCANVNSKKYSDFSDAVLQSNQVLEKSLAVVAGSTRENLITRMASEPAYKISNIYIEAGVGYSWKMDNSPLYIEMKKTVSKAEQLNRIFFQYTELLISIAGNSPLATEQFENMSSDLNNNVSSLSSETQKEIDENKVSIFSAMAIQSFKAYLDGKRSEYLSRAIQSNQPTVEKFSENCISLVRIMRNIIRNSYNEQFLYASKEWNKAQGQSQKRIVASNLIDMNDNYINTLKLLEEIEMSYTQLPQIHKSLSEDRDDWRLALKNNALNLQSLYGKLKSKEKSNE